MTRRSSPPADPEAFAALGDRIYEREVLPHIGPDDMGKFVVIDVTTGAYELDSDEVIASDRLFTRYPEAQAWLRRVGYRYAHRFGLRSVQPKA